MTAVTFTDQDLDRIAAAVEAAEGLSRGEIVTVVADSSDDYDEARWRGAALGAVLTALGAGLLHALGGFWGGAGLLWVTLPTLVGLGLGWLLVAWIDPLRRALVEEEVLDRRTRLRAEAEFLEHEVFDTRDRSGVLLFVSLFEHRVVVLGDAGIEARVAPGEWDDMVAGIVAAIRQGRATDGLVEAVGHCGRILERKGLEIRPDDVDELPNRPHLEGDLAREGRGEAGRDGEADRSEASERDQGGTP